MDESSSGFTRLFAVLTLLIVSPGSISGHGEPFSTSLWGVILAFTGPFTGIASQGFYASYGTPGLTLYCCASLAAGLFFQLIPLPLGTAERLVRLLTWSLALLGWFGGTVLSTLALEKKSHDPAAHNG